MLPKALTEQDVGNRLSVSQWVWGQHAHSGLLMLLQVLAQRDVIGEQNERCRDLEASTRQLEERCSELKEASGGHEARAREEAAEVLKGNRIIEKLTVRDNAGAAGVAYGLCLLCLPVM